MINLETMINYYRSNFGIEDIRDDARMSLGEHCEEIIYNDTISLDIKKQWYRDHQLKKYNEWFSEGNIPNIVSNDSFYLDVWKDICADIESGKSDLPYNNMDEQICSLLSAILYSNNNIQDTNEKKLNGVQLNSILRKYISEGYNIFPLMRCIKEKERKMYIEKSKGNEVSENIRDHKNAFLMLNSAINMCSPYRKLFNIANKIGSLSIERADMARQGKDAGEIEERILELKESLNAEISQFDLYELESVLKNRQGLIADDYPNLKDIVGTQDEALYSGLQDVLYRVRSQQKNMDSVM